jgi:vacuolar-type H+-ATPase subunit E/Vma4
MSLQVILEAIREPGEAELRQIKAGAEAQAAAILAKAEIEAGQIHRATCEKVMRRAAAEHARLIYQAQAKALQRIGDARAAAMDAALDEVARRLKDLRADPGYADVLRHLIEEALSALQSSLQETDRIILEADPRDAALIPEFDSKVDVHYTLNCWGGVVARDQGRQVAVMNTLETRLNRASPALYRDLGAMLESSLDTNDG